jgi:uncharacterized phage protein gp47/JayE
MMLLKRMTIAIFAFALFSVNAQEGSLNLNIDGLETVDLESLELDLEKYYESDLYVPKSDLTGVSSLLSNNQTGNLMVLDNANQEELEAYLNMMLMKRRHPMEKTGRILTYIGVPLAIIGGIMVAGADELYYECVNGNCTGDARGGFGVVGLAAGGGMSIAGAILWIIGSKK